MAAVAGHARQISEPYVPEPKRRRVYSSESGSYDGPTDRLTPLLHTYELHRVGTPPLVPLPLETSPISQNSEVFRNFNNPQVQRDIESILQKYEIEVDFMGLGLRHIPLELASEGVTTFYVRTTRRMSFKAANQRNCVAELYDLLRRSKVTISQGVVTVEMVGFPLWAEKRISHLEVSHPFYKAWKSGLRESFLSFLSLPQPLLGKVHSMDLVRLGFDLNTPSNNPVVISITVDWTINPPDYETIKGGMIRSLREANFPDVLVEFERGEVFFGGKTGAWTEPTFKMLNITQAALTDIRPGSSISNGTAMNPAPNGRHMGTAGVILEIFKVDSSQVVATVVLTNYHVARTGLPGFNPPNNIPGEQKWFSPEPSSICEKLDNITYWELNQRSGLMKDVSQHVFRSPSFRALSDSAKMAKQSLALEEAALEPTWDDAAKADHQINVSEWRTLIKTLENPKYPVQQIGSIFYSAGLFQKHSGGGRFDVAAIRIDDDALKKASNDISHRVGEWDVQHKPTSKKINQVNMNFAKDDPVQFTKEVYKIGAMTGCSYGTVNSEKISNVHLAWHDKNDWSYEVAVVGEKSNSPDPFSWQGDSGAAVFDKGGVWLGMLYGGQTKLGTSQPFTYIIPAWCILEDIKSQSNGKLEARLKA